MSWETFTVGAFELKDDILQEEKERLISELENALEAKIEWDEKYKEYHFSDINWVSHVKSREIGEIVEKNKQLLKRFDCSVYCLSDPDGQIFYDEDGGEDVEIMEE